MTMRRPTFGSTIAMGLAALIAAMLALMAGGHGPARAQAPKPIEPDALKPAVAEGKLPPVEKRVPAEPYVVSLDGPSQSIGRHGGMITQLMGHAKDIRRMSAFGYTRLVCYGRDFKLMPDILKSFEVEEGRIFTLTLRKGHRWSDGKPFTTEDFRFYWEDIASNAELSPGGPDRQLMIAGKPPKVEVIDAQTIRYSWELPNPYFLPALASATPLTIYRPAHYLKRYHKRYAKADKLEAEIKKRNRRDWIDLYFNRDRMARLDRPGFPSLDPWINTTEPPSERFVFERNPYYHHVDPEGRQLPYIDKVAITIAAAKLIPPKVGAGEVELQSRGLSFSNYTLLKRGEKRNDYKVRLWPSSRGSQVALYPNLNVADPVWRQLLRDVRFRRALSLSVDRHEINQVIYFGLGKESANTVQAASPLFKPEYARAWATHDHKAAAALLDAMGLTERDGRGIRLLPDGRPLEIIVETAGEDTEHADILELIRDSWRKVGVALFIKPQTRETLRRRVAAGLTVMSVFFGIDNGVATADFSPHEFVPANDDQLQWPQWGLHHLTMGKMGQEPDMPEVLALLDHYRRWARATSEADKVDAWHAILKLNAEQVFSIGVVNEVPQPVVISNQLNNVPEKAIYSWDPGAHFGVFRPESFWLDDAKRGS